MTRTDRSSLSAVWFKVTDLDVTSGAGCWATSADGGRYLDFSSGIAVTSTGHCHPRVVAAFGKAIAATA
jgi:4-aminobutyrate aminotransferase-like enzyme